LIDLDWDILPISQVMRLLMEIVIIAAVISLGWNRPFKEQLAQVSTTIESKLNHTGSKLQKNQDPSVRRY
jgi:Tfp pilus assembly protein PilO